MRLGAGLMAHVVDLAVEPETRTLLGSVPGFGGSIVAVCRCTKGRPQMATVRPGVFAALEPGGGRRGTIEEVGVELRPEEVRCRVVERSIGRAADLGRAERVVVAGLGCGGDVALAQRLARALGGSLAVSRPLADRGVAPRDAVVGSTGTSLRGRLAVVLGVSGAAHFVSGIRGVETVVAVNTDRDAPIFQHADYCVVGDLFEVVPRLAELLERSQGGEA